MPGRPYRSSLIPYEEEILSLRCRRPPTPYSQISELLNQKYQLKVCRETIFKFIRVRSRGRKMYAFRRAPISKKSASARSTANPSNPGSHEPMPKFEFRYSERYNLTRLPPEVAAARRKKLEEEGH